MASARLVIFRSSASRCLHGSSLSRSVCDHRALLPKEKVDDFDIRNSIRSAAQLECAKDAVLDHADHRLRVGEEVAREFGRREGSGAGRDAEVTRREKHDDADRLNGVLRGSICCSGDARRHGCWAARPAGGLRSRKVYYRLPPEPQLSRGRRGRLLCAAVAAIAAGTATCHRCHICCHIRPAILLGGFESGYLFVMTEAQVFPRGNTFQEGIFPIFPMHKKRLTPDDDRRTFVRAVCSPTRSPRAAR